MLRRMINSPLGRNARYFIKWCGIAYFLGAVGGIIGGLFAMTISQLTHIRIMNSWIIYFMPFLGLFIAWLYDITDESKSGGTNMILSSLQSDKPITKTAGLLIVLSTITSHFAGASVGREGAALQLGGWVGDSISPFFHLDDNERHIAIMTGMSAMFSALFGTPVAAAFFCLEVVNIGIFHYAAMLPCLLAAFVGNDISLLMGNKPELFTIIYVPDLSYDTVYPIVVLGLLLSVLSVVWIVSLHKSEYYFKKWIPNPYLRVIIGSLMIIGLTFLLDTREYWGSSMSLIEHSLGGNIQYEAFILKLIFTCISIGCGFKGGEIVPTLCVGATFGASFGMMIGFHPSLMAACGMIGLFSAVTNCPISSILIGLELFKGEGIAYYAAIVSIAFTLSGYYSLYGTQKFAYGKLKNVVINRSSNH